MKLGFNLKTGLCIAVGTLLSNWLLDPLVFHRRTVEEGFVHGAIAATIIVLACLVIDVLRIKKKLGL